jgi:serine/threonine protein kinase
LCSIRNSNVIPFKDCGEGVFKPGHADDINFYGVVTEYNFKESLFSILVNEFKYHIEFKTEDKLHIFKEIIQTVIILLELNILHCDLKAENIVVSPDRKMIKLIDFGCAIFGMERSPFIHPNYINKTSYRAPELREDYTQHSEKSEVFALGCILFQLLFLRNPFDTADPLDKKYSYISSNSRELYWQSQSINRSIVNKLLEDLLFRMFATNPEDRPTFKELLNHPLLIKY